MVPKRNSKVRVCLDPKDLNKTIRRTHPLPTLEDASSRLHNDKVFSVVDIQTGFWHVELDKKIKLSNNFQHTIWALSLASCATWHKLSTKNFSSKNEPNC